MILQTQTVRHISLESCIKIRDLGIKPTTNGFYFAKSTHPHYKDIVKFWRWDTEGDCFVCDGIDVLDAVFCPDAEQLLQLIKQVNGGNYGMQMVYGTFIEKESFIWHIPSMDFSGVLPNENLAEYLAQVLIFLLTEKP